MKMKKTKMAGLAVTAFLLLGIIALFVGCGDPDPETVTYTVTVNAGTGATGGGSYEQGATVSIYAGTAPAGLRFDEWTANPAVTWLNNSRSSPTASFTMPAIAVTVTAQFETIPTHSLTVVSEGTNATASGTRAEDSTVTINAGEPPTGKRFKEWTSANADVTFANANSAETTFTMPHNAVTVTANFEAILYTITIFPADPLQGSFTVQVDGQDTEQAKYNDTVHLHAQAETANWFEKFIITGLGATPTELTSDTATFTMPAGDVTVQAVFEGLLPGNGAAQITIRTEADFDGLQNPITLSKSEGQPLSITLTDHTSVAWYIDGVPLSAPYVSGDTLILNADYWSEGLYSLTAVVRVGSLQYSKVVNFTVTE